MVKRELIDLELGKLNQRVFPSMRMTSAEMQNAVDMMSEDLPEWMTQSDFVKAIQYHRKQSNFVPTSKDLLEAWRNMPKDGRLSLPPGKFRTTPEMQRILDRAKLLRERDGLGIGDSFRQARQEIEAQGGGAR